MTPDRFMRTALGATAVMNIVVALLAAAADSPLGRAAGLPLGVPTVYRFLLGWTIALFGLGYAWLAVQPEMLRPLVVFALLGKGGVVAILFVLWLGGSVETRLALLGSGDLLFVGVFAWWLWRERAESS